eukprot:404095-Amphidinium_carterae.1
MSFRKVGRGHLLTPSFCDRLEGLTPPNTTYEARLPSLGGLALLGCMHCGAYSIAKSSSPGRSLISQLEAQHCGGNVEDLPDEVKRVNSA